VLSHIVQRLSRQQHLRHRFYVKGSFYPTKVSDQYHLIAMNTIFRTIILCLFFCALCAGTASAQNLYLKSPRYYQYSGDSLPGKIYLFPNDDKEVEILVEKISNIAGIKRPDSFLLSANVTDVVALLHEGKRHILYNAFYFIKTKDESLRVALLAHAIGLHANQSQFPLQKVPRWEEELKADEFMGYALFFMGVQQNAALSVPERLPLGFPVDIDDRRTAILMGWKRANSKAVFADGKNFPMLKAMMRSKIPSHPK
jgi:hypothetical protein